MNSAGLKMLLMLESSNEMVSKFRSRARLEWVERGPEARGWMSTRMSFEHLPIVLEVKSQMNEWRPCRVFNWYLNILIQVNGTAEMWLRFVLKVF